MDQRVGDRANRAPPRQPVFNAPAVVLAMIAVLVAIHGALQLVSASWQDWVIYAFSFIPSRLTDPGFPVLAGSQVWSFLTYALLHGSWMHLIFNCIWLLVFGTPAARYLGTARFLALSVISALGGALASLALHWGEFVIMIGASGIVSGLMGAAMPLIFARATPAGRQPARPQDLLANRNALLFIGVFFAITVFSGASGWTGTGFLTDTSIAWEAHVGGFITGLAAFYLLAPRPVP